VADEEAISAWLYDSAKRDNRLDVLSWQAIDGKGYFTADVKLRLPSGERLEPDLVLLQDKRVLWILEVKGDHKDALRDESKLTELIDLISLPSLIQQLSARTGFSLNLGVVRIGVAFGDAWAIEEFDCLPQIAHICQARHEKMVEERGLAALLDDLVSPQQ
jgi:hypothetical protein